VFLSRVFIILQSIVFSISSLPFHSQNSPIAFYFSNTFSVLMSRLVAAVITFIVDGNRRFGAAVVLILWLEAGRKRIEVRLIKRLGVILAEPQVNI